MWSAVLGDSVVCYSGMVEANVEEGVGKVAILYI